MLGGRYELDREIGRGGMGAVWLGHDTVLDRAVAIKQIGLAHGGAEPDLERAEREAHLAARINHQNVVAVFDLVDEDGQQWLVMEHVDGPTLAAVVAERGAVSDAELAPIVEQVAGALAAAHQHGIVHRDVKPSNILLTSNGVAKLSDFGVARAQADAVLTQTGLVTGSPAYLSPEVASGRTATAASDVWSLGATIFHALAGHPPYEIGESVLGAMYRIVNDEPPRLEHSSRLATLVAAMMQHDPAARPTMVEIAELAELVHDDTVESVDLDATQGFAAFTDSVEPSPTAAIPPIEPPPPPAPVPPAAPVHDAPRRAIDRRVWLLVAAAAVIVGIVAIGSTLGGDEPSDAPSTVANTAQTATPTADPETPTPAPVDGVTAATLQGFVADYLMTASNDPAAGFKMLTPDFQRQSNGMKGYRGFWSKVSNLDVTQVSADPEALKVSYTYSYDFDGEPRTDAVTLQLEKSGEGFLISGEV